MKLSTSRVAFGSLALLVTVQLVHANSCGSGTVIEPIGKHPTFVSLEGTATLIGFSEFTNLSSPPKKYLRKATSGTICVGEWTESGCETPSLPISWGTQGNVSPDWAGYTIYSASLVPIAQDASGTTRYRASISVVNLPDNRATDIDILVLGPVPGNVDDFSMTNGQERDVSPGTYTASLNWKVVGNPRQVGSADFGVELIVQTRDEWNIVQEYDASDPSGSTWTANTNASVRYKAFGTTFPMTAGGTVSGIPSLSSYLGLLRESLTATTRTLSGTEVCTATASGSTKAQGLFRETLSNEDTDDAAKDRANITVGASNVAYCENRTTGFSFDFSSVRYRATFDISCPGEYDVVVRYNVKPHGTSGPGDPRALIEHRHFESGVQTVEGLFDPKVKDVDYTIESVVLMVPCGNEGATGGSFDLGSVKGSLSLGSDAAGFSAGALLVDADAITAALYTPSALVPAAAEDGAVEIVRTTSGVLRQVKAPQVLADVVVLDASTYEVRFYPLAQVGAQDSTTKIYAVSGTAAAVYKFENPDAPNLTTLRITETRGSGTKVTEYSFDSATSTWSLSRGNGLRQESMAIASVGGNTLKTTTVSNDQNEIVAKTARTYHTFPWGEELVQEVLDPDAAALTTTYDFYDTLPTSDPNYGRLKQRTDANGGWERLTYAADGRVLKSIRPFLNAAPTTTEESLCRVTENTYDTIADGDDDELPEARTTTVERTLGQETSRRYRIDWSNPVTLDGTDFARRSEIRCVTADAEWNASGNLVTETLTYQTDPFIGRPRRVVNPDGTASLTLYVLDANGISTTTAKTGAPNAALTDIVDGTSTVTVTNAAGQVTEETVADMASTEVLSSWVATEFDSVGRPTRLDYTDDTYITRDYACCGLSAERDRTGLVTDYHYDDLGRQYEVVRQGVTTRTGYDADGRVKTITRIGTDSTEIVLESSMYDLAGRRTERRDARNRPTGYNETFSPTTGQTTRTTTNPDLGTIIEVLSRDGSRVSIGGTAAAPINYDYGVETDGLFTKEIRVGVDENGDPTDSEWAKTYIDFAGRTYKIVYADDATAQSYFNSFGQLERQVDPDGITTLFGYNGRGEIEVTAIDMDRDNLINYDGSDRIAKTVSNVDTHDTYTVQKTTTEVWETDEDDTPTTISISEQSVDGMRSWQTLRSLETSMVTEFDGEGGRTVTATTPDSVVTVQVYTGDWLASTTIKSSTDEQVFAVSYTYDPHGRLETSADARNGTTTFTYYDDDQIHTITTPDPDSTRTGNRL